MLNFFSDNPYFFFTLSLIFGLAVGSFLNVVIYRLPLMLHNAWRNECCELLEIKNKKSKEINLMFPHSHCPHCQKSLKSWHNIPVLSFLVLKAKCAYCRHPIGWRYPFVELLTGLLTLFIAMHFGVTFQALAAIVFTWSLIALTFIDFDHQLLPDDITLPLLWLGLLLNIFGLFTDLQSAVIGATAGYLSLWLVAKLFYLLTGKIGMGNGDFKLLAVIGAWLGWQILPLIILLASFVGAIVGISLILFKKQGRHVPIPFGPYLAVAGWVGLIFNSALLNIYSYLIY